ncbi:MAG: hypothetical protein AAGD43_10790 [Pseudomonadota bacterium]
MKLTDKFGTVLSLSIGIAILSVGFPTAAGASTMVNADRVARNILVIKGSTRTPHELKPGAVMKDVCAKGCIVRIDEDANRDFVLEGTERVTIEGGLLYYDGELTRPAPVKNNSQ